MIDWRMDTKKVLAYYGSKHAAFTLLGISRQVWYYWTKAGIPEGWQWKIQALTDGKLKAKKK